MTEIPGAPLPTLRNSSLIAKMRVGGFKHLELGGLDVFGSLGC